MGTTWQKALSARNGDRARSPIELERPSEFVPSGWFLGPNAENLEVMEKLVVHALHRHANARRTYTQSDGRRDPDMTPGPFPVTGPTFDHMYRNLETITGALNGSIPLSSHRNQSHMYWDITMPGAVGYFAGMLFNQNNVAAEASPVTTGLEIGVARDLCRMLGFPRTKDREPWGHITCDGSVANLEAMWAARNLKYLPVALARAIRELPDLEKARHLSVTMPDGREAFLLDLDIWELLNLDVDTALALQKRMVTECGVAGEAVQAGIDTFSIAALGAAAFNAELLQGAVPAAPAIIIPATAHYSWKKAATILGLGTNSVHSVPVDLDGRMIVPDLHAALQRCLDEQRPVIQVVAVIGTTEEGAIDPLDEILELRARFARLGLTFALHADAAWGGYFASMLRDPAEPQPDTSKQTREHTAFDDVPAAALSPHAIRQYHALPQVDTVTLDPHKSGYIPYPAGSLCYRNQEMIYQVAYTAPVVFHDGDAPTVGVYGVEGSKPGAAAVGVSLSHASIPPDRRGYGRLLGRCIFNSKRFYAAVATLAAPDDDFIVVPFNRLPAERDGGTTAEIEKQRALIRKTFIGISNEELRRRLGDGEPESDLMKLFRSLGPDLTVCAYAFNFKWADGRLNDDLNLMNAFNKHLFDAMSIQTATRDDAPPSQNFFVTSSQFPPDLYGRAFTDQFARRAGVDPIPHEPIRFLISTMQNPFVTATAAGNFLPDLMDALRTYVEAVRKEMLETYGPGGTD